ncbi:putative phosphatidate phosphatase [Helianthus annuus]|uniref:Phosphatidate phosphatase n=2 Tax=Helianthus annuus TaxID=4232 RepID=A0A9K3DQX6_HELAN|nr:probable lipid phosphate phosphatase 4 [Helianthus annuus]KAF5759937.1 putative phosphatidate phosphatase [Helianthus annuus]KAJ0438061.1 putative phosphatidate phosphatase [Helianthus annuus]KAJ0442681.1 putative phosphatidate phosphatase [Helianthus annuus]KAJ0460385.1 putative phosphatidate phosphatase [Helianthus annuus]KAJ0640826.1 putative phosphatidate phosphatase [Helianthus annuus]
MSERHTGNGARTISSHGKEILKEHSHDWAVLLLLGLTDFFLNMIEPFHRYVAQDMMTDIKYPFYEKDTIPMWAVPFYAGILPIMIFFIYYMKRKDVYDVHHAVLGLLYSLLITAVITDSIKDAVGRPRPNFFYRCFPDGNAEFGDDGNVLCHGDLLKIKEGYKSFPSGHTSWSFAGLGFLAWYLCGKLRTFDNKGHAQKLCVVVLPYLFAALVGVSRVDDYWHHWTDVFTGMIIGTTVSAFCYLQFFPFPNHENGWAPHAFFNVMEMERSREIEGATARYADLEA